MDNMNISETVSTIDIQYVAQNMYLGGEEVQSRWTEKGCASPECGTCTLGNGSLLGIGSSRAPRTLAFMEWRARKKHQPQCIGSTGLVCP